MTITSTGPITGTGTGTASRQHQPCPPWCSYEPNEHLEDEHVRYHFGPEHTVTLTLEKPELCWATGSDGGPHEPVVFPSQLSLYLEQRRQHREARVNLSQDASYGVYLTLAEARELAEALGKTIREAEAST